MEGDDEASLKNNAMYALSVAKRIGAVIFAVWENIVEVNPK